MAPLAAALVIVGIFLLLMWFLAETDHLAFLGPRSTRGIGASASYFCTDDCRVEGRCPMTGGTTRNRECPLWKYVDADVPIEPHGSPFER